MDEVRSLLTQAFMLAAENCVVLNRVEFESRVFLNHEGESSAVLTGIDIDATLPKT